MNGMIAPLVELYNRDLDRLVNEIESYEIESDLWLLNGDIKNTAGNLCLHLCGNLQHFFGFTQGYSRKMVSENIDKPLAFDNTKSRHELGVYYKSVDEALIEMLNYILDNNMLV